MVTALQRAASQGLTSPQHWPRVEVGQQRYMYLSLGYSPFADPWDEGLTLRVEDVSSHALDWIQWEEGQSTADVRVQVGGAIQRESGESLDVAAFFRGLADLFEVAYSTPERRPAVQLCPPQWVITTRGVVTYGSGRLYSVSHRQLRDDAGITSHVAEKTWSDADSFEEARHAALELFPDTSGEPPF